MHEQNIICSKTRLDGTTHEQTIICRQLFAGHVVDSRPIERKEKLHRMRKRIGQPKEIRKVTFQVLALVTWDQID